MDREPCATERGPVRRPWRFDLSLQRDGATSQQTQLTRALIHEIRRGRLPAGALLPGSRPLAQQLGINRKVVVAAVEALVAQGWLQTRPASGTFVAEQLPELSLAATTLPAAPKPVQRKSAQLVLDEGLPDPRLLPVNELGRGFARALRGICRAPFAYGDPAGDLGLRSILSHFVNQTRGLATSVDEIMVTRGAQGALSVYALSQLSRGDIVAVEVPGHVAAWRTFELAGAKIAHVPVDADGLCTDHLAQLARRAKGKLKAVYVTPHHQYPTSVAMTPQRRAQLLELAAKHHFTVIENDYDHEYHFDGAPPLPLHALDAANHVIYIASLSKLLAPNIRLGYLIAPPAQMTRLRQVRALLERQGNLALERALAELFEDGTVRRHARRARREYQARRDHMVAELRATPALRKRFDFKIPAGGLALWLQLRTGSADELVLRAREQRLLLTPGSAYTPHAAPNALRVGFAAHNQSELSRRCAALARAAAQLRN